jgi:hypothetical protein
MGDVSENIELIVERKEALKISTLRCQGAGW